MSSIKVRDKKFSILKTQVEIEQRIQHLAEQINRDYAQKNPLLIVVLKGAFRFAAGLIKHLDIPLQFTFIRLKSYQGTRTTGEIEELYWEPEALQARHIILLEDIVDTGQTLRYLWQKIQAHQPHSIALATLLCKPNAFSLPFPIDYTGFEISEQFVIGYGLDYQEEGRELNAIYQLEPEEN